ncbi:hypothetical protein EU805_14540 [Salipiger sp. IMCC34102]|uniref:hypothetical protein n=1 Tax=Salipiger sp. IMCC34102 TaxID=2510647 RepID=UPI00101D7A1D|nr:hypothetical protein [Salipiger sp. IMCC34102]RYH01218.1 hypothetical protein EU805_14540 [Salipiger sp. IMCC34102]
MKTSIALVFALLLTAPTAADPVDTDGDTLFIGHSLIAFDIPTIVQAFVAHAGGAGRTEAQITNGAPMLYNWQHSAQAQGVDARAVLPSGRFDAVVLTEAIPLANHLAYSDSVGTAAKFHALATGANAGAQVFLYETWHDLRSGTGVDVQWDEGDDVAWRARLDADRGLWQGIVDEVNAQRAPGSPKMRVIPAGQAMGALADAIAADRVPGVAAIDDLFDDSIHTNATGAYFVALVMVASIYGIDPVGLPHRVPLASYNRHAVPPETAAALQRVAADVLTDRG